MPTKRQRIVVPQRVINGGFDFKFETDPYNVKLHGLMTESQYTEVVGELNQRLKPSRSKKIDTALLVTGPLMVPLALWGVRHGMLTKKRKRLLKQYIEEFNTRNPGLHMRWNRRPQSSLTIERREQDIEVAPSRGSSLSRRSRSRSRSPSKQSRYDSPQLRSVEKPVRGRSRSRSPSKWGTYDPPIVRSEQIPPLTENGTSRTELL